MKEIFESINYGFMSTGIFNIASENSKLAILFLPRDVTAFKLNNILPSMSQISTQFSMKGYNIGSKNPWRTQHFFIVAVRAIRKVLIHAKKFGLMALKDSRDIIENNCAYNVNLVVNHAKKTFFCQIITKKEYVSNVQCIINADSRHRYVYNKVSGVANWVHHNINEKTI